MNSHSNKTVLDVLDSILKEWAYDYEINSNFVYVAKENVSFVKNELSKFGYSYIEVKPRAYQL